MNKNEPYLSDQEIRNLNSMIIKRFGSKRNFAKRMNFSEGQLSDKVNGKVKISQPEISLMLLLLNCKYEDIFEISIGDEKQIGGI